jgi:hypothetical protein
MDGTAEVVRRELKRKFPDKKLDDIIIAVKAKFDRDVSSSTLCAWLKPETAAKIEQLANASGKAIQSVEGSATIPSWSTRCSWGTRREGPGDVLTQKAKELALIPELEVSGFVCSSGWLTNFNAMASALRSGMARPARPEASVQLAQTHAGGVAGQDGENPVNVQPRTPSTWTSPACTGQQPVAGARDCRKWKEA